MKDYDILKCFCKIMFWLGMGDVWLENGLMNCRTWLYRLYSSLVVLTAMTIVGLEILAALFGDFPEDQKNDAISLSVSHTLDLIKIFSVLLKRQHLKLLIRDLVRVCEPHERDHEMKEKHTTIKYNTYAYFVLISMSAMFYYFEAVRKVYSDGEHYVAIVTFWPMYDDESNFATLSRVVISLVTTVMLMWLVFMDCFAMSFLIIVKYKFRTLGNYFESMTEELGHRTEGKEFIKLFSEGITMHQEILRLTKILEYVFGFMLSVHVVKSYMSVITLLLSVMLAEQQTSTSALKALFFIIALIFLLALFLCNAGEITWQASELSRSIFNCGWHLCPRDHHRQLGMMVMTSCIMAQRPLVFKAFNMFELTYSTFISVLKGIYSLFTLLYNRKQK